MTANPDSLPASVDPGAIRAQIALQVTELAPGKSICPSDVARALAGPLPDQWSRIMIPIRRVAVDMALGGSLIILRKGKIVDPSNFRGVYRLAAPRID